MGSFLGIIWYFLFDNKLFVGFLGRKRFFSDAITVLLNPGINIQWNKDIFRVRLNWVQ